MWSKPKEHSTHFQKLMQAVSSGITSSLVLLDILFLGVIVRLRDIISRHGRDYEVSMSIHVSECVCVSVSVCVEEYILHEQKTLSCNQD